MWSYLTRKAEKFNMSKCPHSIQYRADDPPQETENSLTPDNTTWWPNWTASDLFLDAIISK